MNLTDLFLGKFRRSHVMAAVVPVFVALVAILVTLPSNTARGAGAIPQSVSTGQDNLAQPMDCGLVWRVVPSPNNASNDFLAGIYVVSADDIWAAGDYYSPEVRGMMQHWNGSVWSVVTVPEPGYYSFFNNISGSSATDIWAVGYYAVTSSSNARSFMVHWNGTAWSQVTLPLFGTTSDLLTSVKAIAPDAAWAVGIHEQQTLALLWDGTTWASITTPNPDARSVLVSVTALNVDDMWAVGYFSAGSGTIEHTFTIHCSRSGCSTVASPNSGEGDNELLGVAALSSNEIYAVGYSEVITSPSTTVPLATRWDGIGWSMLPTPPIPPDAQNVPFTTVSAFSSNAIWALGYAYNSTTRQGPAYAAKYDGSTWTAFNPPNRGPVDNLNGSGIIGPDDVWAVGSYSTGDNINQTLIEHYSDPCATPSPTVPPVVTQTPSPEPTSVTCPIQFNDVPQGSAFYTYVRCLACRTILSGYPCGGVGEPCPGSYFRPGHNVTRGQAAKIISNAAGYDDNIPSSQQSFNDVPATSAFWVYVERVHLHGAISGYPCGGVGEPCPGTYFRPGANLARGQLAKIDTTVAGYTDPAPTTPTFADVPPASTFYVYIERAHTHNIISGYACGGAGEPCPGTYFRPGLNVTRGQTAKIIGNTFFPNCQTPSGVGYR